MSTPLEELRQALDEVLRSHDFTVVKSLNLDDTTFDIVAEDHLRLVFIVLRSNNDNWLDDFREHQASLAQILSMLNLGKKWRDVYLLEITTDPINTDTELEM